MTPYLQLVLEQVLLVGKLAIQSEDFLLFLGKGLIIVLAENKTVDF